MAGGCDSTLGAFCDQSGRVVMQSSDDSGGGGGGEADGSPSGSGPNVVVAGGRVPSWSKQQRVHCANSSSDSGSLVKGAVLQHSLSSTGKI